MNRDAAWLYGRVKFLFALANVYQVLLLLALAGGFRFLGGEAALARNASGLIGFALLEAGMSVLMYWLLVIPARRAARAQYDAV
jgi:hypothetical protein